MTRGALCISIDLELAWGIWDQPSAEYFRLCAEKEHYIVDRLLKMFATYEVPATWAFVGRLLERAGPIPVSTREGERIWYAPEIIDAIRKAAPAQDIGSHTFSHLYFQESEPEALRKDLNEARRVHEEHALDFSSFVFPRNQVAHVDLLSNAGIRVFRSMDVGWHITALRRLGQLAGRVANLADKMIPVRPMPVRPVVHEGGIVELPSSMLLLARSGLRKLVRPEVAEAKARLGLSAARRTGGIFHLWFHPSNFYWGTDRQLQVLDRILRAAAAMRDLGQLDIRPMKSYAQA